MTQARRRSRVILAHHLVPMGYAHWLPNDLRGSGSDEIRNQLLADLGDIHAGRKWIQPSREDLKEFHQAAEPKLEQEVIWFDEQMRATIAESFAATAENFGYKIYACAVLKNHAHLVVPRHQHQHELMWRTFAESAAASLRDAFGISDRHRIWGNRPYSKFLYTPHDILTRIDYVNDNPEKKGLPRQHYDFITPYPR